VDCKSQKLKNNTKLKRTWKRAINSFFSSEKKEKQKRKKT